MQKVTVAGCVNIELGGTVIAFLSRDEGLNKEFPPRYAPFMTDKAPEVSVEIRHDFDFHVPDLGRTVFDSGGNWSLHQSGDQQFIKIHSPRYDPLQIVSLSPDLRENIIHCVGEQWVDGELYPLGYPLEELLTVMLLAQGRGVLLHASAVKMGDRGILFSGMSGAGKSTMASLWDGLENATVLSDDRVIVRQHDGQMWAYGTPWHGSARISSPEAVQLDHIFILHHAERNTATSLSAPQAAAMLLARSFPPLWDAQGMDFTLSLLDRMVKTVSCTALGFVPDKTALEYVQWLCAHNREDE
ncbi:MAG: hypothetical protein P1S60_04105 [Anaerolineae bacterium]|nr:hypothetical protein [Anaerolineae bacterium]